MSPRFRVFHQLILPMVGVVVSAATRPVLGQSQVSSPPMRSPEASYRAPAVVRGAGPNGATLQCRDGSFPAPAAADAACDRHGGVLARFPLIRQPGPSTAADLRLPTPAAVTDEAALVAPPPVTPRRADVLVRVPSRPSDATAVCADGTYIRADSAVTARCATHGGVHLRFAPRPPR